MAYEWIWYNSELPQDVVSALISDLEKFESSAQVSGVFGSASKDTVIREEARRSTNSWVHENHWSAGFVMHYAQLANKSNFLYDLTGLDGHGMQYGIYKEGGHYDWHRDYGLENTDRHPVSHVNGINETTISSHLRSSCEFVRKISFSLQLSDPSDYEGGELQVKERNDEIHTMPKDRGTIVFFDSRVLHRVAPVIKGERRSLVGWIVGPRWK